MVTLSVRPLEHFAGLPLPAYQSDLAAGADVAAACGEQGIVLPPGGRALIPTGLIFAIPAGYELQVRPRSGLALKYGVTVLNAPGTIDADYRGEVQILLCNQGGEPFIVERGMRVAQLVLSRVEQASYAVCEELPESSRGGGGFGHTGL